MLKLFKFLFIFVILALLALAVFTLFSDITPKTETVTAPVEIANPDATSNEETGEDMADEASDETTQ